MDAYAESSVQHIPKLPRFVFFVRIAQALVALIALALSAASLALFGTTILSGNLGFVIFVSLATWIVVAYLCCTPIYKPSLYNRWAALGLEIFCVIFWLPAFASIGAWASLHSAYSLAYDYDCEDYGGCRYKTAWQTAAAAAGMGGLEFVLFLVTLITYSVFLHRHRMQNASAGHGYGGAPPAQPHAQPPVDMQNLGYAPKEQVTYNQQPVYPH